ncbi:helix-turn-helix domain-containing protein [Sporomusa acidovorans]|uniref:HTH cro/C1-type domain-containing protein n=1 Tax=Sporomusa acidovorans (strain ATCC 49682 / DSM 3132 / Mol) TaxID=1123286 RepID=A0ABZ3J8X6_SPOA4|nr:helix-turn-helix transcriptional regulator [Sporomusa acidovorans]OZC16125.1 HTH-type transcriptional regulator ImmR [Sporomusa acidovorans DSM 3132]SDD85921.1 DNA-binding transcriptional regulator, XRE-family HTH domain [Sporomusa acidovorans]
MFRQKIFCERLKALRLSQNLTLEQLANELDLVKQTIGNWEKGIRIPSLETSIALAEYFNVSLDYLVGLSDEPKRR